MTAEWKTIDSAPKEDGAEYLVWDGYDVWLVNVCDGDWWCLAEFRVGHPTHWMPLPSPPNQEGKEK